MYYYNNKIMHAIRIRLTITMYCPPPFIELIFVSFIVFINEHNKFNAGSREVNETGHLPGCHNGVKI